MFTITRKFLASIRRLLPFIVCPSSSINRHFLLILLLVALTPSLTPAATVDLKPLLDASNAPTLSAGNIYYLNSYTVSGTKTIAGNGATIEIRGSSPWGASGSSASLTLDNCKVKVTNGCWAALSVQSGATLLLRNKTTVANSVNTGVFASSGNLHMIDSSVGACVYGINVSNASSINLEQTTIAGCTYSILATGGTIAWNGGSITQSSGTAVGLTGVTANFSNIAVTMSQTGTIAFNYLKSSTGALHKVTISGASFAVQVENAAVTVDQGSNFSCPYKWLAGAGSGIASLKGAPLTVRDTAFTGFENAVDVRPCTSPNPTFIIERCAFLHPEVSAICATNAVNSRMVDCVVRDAIQDGVWFSQSSNVTFERNQVTGSLNTGVSFVGSSNSIARDNYVSGSAHQALTAVNGCQNVKFLNNTLRDSALVNLLIDATSSAYARGNVISRSATSGVQIEGAKGTNLESNLLTGSARGFEIRSGAAPHVCLSAIASNKKQGALIYNTGSYLDIRASRLWGNGGSATVNTADSYQIYIDQSATLKAFGNTIGIAKKPGAFNNAGKQSDVANNYWDSSAGPDIHSTGNGPGSGLEWAKGSTFTYTPCLTQPHVLSNMTESLTLAPNQTVTWDSQLGPIISFQGQSGIQTQNTRIAGALRLVKADYLDAFTLPARFIPGHLYNVWIDSLILFQGRQQSLTIPVPDIASKSAAKLLRLSDTGTWEEMPQASWDANAKKITFTPSNAHLLNGTFAVVNGQKTTGTKNWDLYD